MSFRKPTWTKTGLEVPQPSDDVSISPSAATDVDYRKKIKYGNRVQAAWALITEFCGNSTVHGVRYFTEKRRHWSERVWWICAFILSLCLCGYQIRNVYVKWTESPVIVSFAEKSTPVWEIPFPAVTICPETKVKMEFLNFTEAYHILADAQVPPFNMSDDELSRMEAVAQICDAHLTADFKLGENFTDHSIFDVIEEVAPTFEETMFFCKWRNAVSFCEFFKPILTEEGMCFTFNALNSDEIYREGMNEDLISVKNNSKALHWNLENGYDRSIPVDPQTYPYRVFGAGARLGLFTLLRLYKQHLEYLCRGPVQGFKITLHTPGEVPQVSKHYFRVPYLQEVLVAVRPNMITTSEGLRHYDPIRRQCFFDSERNLKFFKVYTQRNCELECLSNFTKIECGCVKFSMPRETDTLICGAAKIQCYNDAEDKLSEKQFTEGLATIPDPTKESCNCLPSCTSITYDAEISQAKFDWISLFTAFKSNLSEFPGMEPARLSIFFKEHQFITSKRSELYGPTDFLAGCGGLLGLFMGVSLLSIVEVIYYCTLRLLCTLRIRRSKKQQLNRVAAAEVANVPGITIDTPDEKKDHAN